MKKMGDLALLLVALIWGGGFIGVQKALDSGFGSFTIIFYRFLIAFVLLALVFYKEFIGLDKEHLKVGSILGIFLFLGFVLQTVGLKYTTPSKNAFITSLNVIIVPFLYWLINKKKPELKVFFASLCVILGVYFLSTGSIKGLGLGDLYTFLCAIFFAFHIVLLGFFGKNKNPMKLTIVQMGVSALLASLFLGIEEMPKVNDLTIFYPIIYLGVFSTMFAFFIQTLAQKYTSSTRAAIILSTEATFGTIFSILIYKEAVGIKMIIGFILFLCSIIMVEADFFKKRVDVNG